MVKLVDADDLDLTLTAEADAIRAKTGSSEALSFNFSGKQGFSSPISEISTSSLKTITVLETQVDPETYSIQFTTEQRAIIDDENTFQFILDITALEGTKTLVTKWVYPWDDPDPAEYNLVSQYLYSGGSVIGPSAKCSYLKYTVSTGIGSFDSTNEITVKGEVHSLYYSLDNCVPNEKALIDYAEAKANKSTSITSSSTDTQYPTAKAVYTFVTSQINEIDNSLKALL